MEQYLGRKLKKSDSGQVALLIHQLTPRITEIEKLSVLELSDLVKALEERDFLKKIFFFRGLFYWKITNSLKLLLFTII